jgi:EAL domain-containing protein (putative c-di-GMP-specific phosphodiesterase class I)
VHVPAGALLDAGLPDRVAAALRAAGVPAAALTLEIAGSAVPDRGRARNTLSRLHGHGVRIALADYGSGRGILPLLRQLPLDEVTLDGRLVAEAVGDPRARAVVRHGVGLAHELGLTVVAAGVADAAVLALLVEVGCDAAQGPHIAPPMPAAALAGWLAGSPLAHSRAGRLAP